MDYRDALSYYSVKPQNDPKCKIEKKDISLTFLYYRRKNNTMTVTYSVTIFNYRDMNGQIIDPSSPKDIDIPSFRKAVIEQISEADRKYVEINLLTTRLVEFAINEKWFEDSMKNLSVFKVLNLFKKEFRLKVLPPLIIRTTCVNSKEWNDLVVEKLKKYITNDSIKKYFSFLNLVKSIFSMSTYFSMFDWSYSSIYNIVEGTLKPKWMAIVLFGASKIIKR